MVRPDQLETSGFAAYPPLARARAEANLKILRRLPLSLAALLLKELISFDWKFPAERREIENQFRYLSGLSTAEFSRAIAPFAALRLSPELDATDWVNAPATFSERFTAHLWATQQINQFRDAAVAHVEQANNFERDKGLPTHRLVIVVMGAGVNENSYQLFRKLRPHGTYYTNVQEGALNSLLQTVAARAGQYPEPYGHWYIDGGSAQTVPGVQCLSYQALTPVRALVQAQMRKTYEAGHFDPEAFRSMLARTSPDQLGMSGHDPLLDHFALTLLTEGSGTQVFATTFVQWAAREVLRRAQPLTVLARFTPRQQEKSMSEMLSEGRKGATEDPEGSLLDADMGAYYTWLNQQRLSEPGRANFLVWFENHAEGLAIGTGIARGVKVTDPIHLNRLAKQLA
jgi:hypothetical protein